MEKDVMYRAGCTTKGMGAILFCSPLDSWEDRTVK